MNAEMKGRKVTYVVLLACYSHAKYDFALKQDEKQRFLSLTCEEALESDDDFDGFGD